MCMHGQMSLFSVTRCFRIYVAPAWNYLLSIIISLEEFCLIRLYWWTKTHCLYLGIFVMGEFFFFWLKTVCLDFGWEKQILYERVMKRDKRIFVYADQSQEREIEKEMNVGEREEGRGRKWQEHKWLFICFYLREREGESGDKFFPDMWRKQQYFL